MLQLPDEAATLGRYLIGSSPTDEEKARYVSAIETIALPMSEQEKMLWARMMNHPTLIPSIDAALALRNPLSPLRQRIFVMLAILEAGPGRTQHFLPQARAGWLFALILPGLRSVFHAATGIVLLTWFESRWKSAPTSS
jgi:hypothetical protein